MNTDACHDSHTLSENISVGQLAPIHTDLNQNVSGVSPNNYNLTSNQSDIQQLKQNQNVSYGDNGRGSVDLVSCHQQSNNIHLTVKHEGNHPNMEYMQTEHGQMSMNYNNMTNTGIHIDNSYSDTTNNNNTNNNNNLITNNMNNDSQNNNIDNSNNSANNSHNNNNITNSSNNLNNNEQNALIESINGKQIDGGSGGDGGIIGGDVSTEFTNNYRSNVINIIDNICSNRGMEVTLNSFSAQELKSLASVLNTHLQLAATKKETVINSAGISPMQQQQQQPQQQPNQRHSPYSTSPQPKKSCKSVSSDKAKSDKSVEDFQVYYLSYAVLHFLLSIKILYSFDFQKLWVFIFFYSFII